MKTKKDKHIFEPCFLIAMPQMNDPNFSQTVSLLSEFNEEGAVALILNRPLQISLYDVISPEFRKHFELEPKTIKTLKQNKVYWGGPVDIQQGLIIHDSKEFESDSVAVADDLYITGSINILKDLIKRQTFEDSDTFFRFILGYAGWGSQQLEQEMSDSCWVTLPIGRPMFECEPESMWKQAVKNLGVELSQLTSVIQERFH